MGERFTIVFKDGERLSVNYPRDSFKFRSKAFRKATIGNVIAVEGGGAVAMTLRKRYGLAEGPAVSNLELISQTTGISKENIKKQTVKVQRRLEKWQRKLEKAKDSKTRNSIEKQIKKLRKKFRI